VTSAAIVWGTQNEMVAVQEFKQKVSPIHYYRIYITRGYTCTLLQDVHF